MSVDWPLSTAVTSCCGDSSAAMTPNPALDTADFRSSRLALPPGARSIHSDINSDNQLLGSPLWRYGLAWIMSNFFCWNFKWVPISLHLAAQSLNCWIRKDSSSLSFRLWHSLIVVEHNNYCHFSYPEGKGKHFFSFSHLRLHNFPSAWMDEGLHCKHQTCSRKWMNVEL